MARLAGLRHERYQDRDRGPLTAESQNSRCRFAHMTAPLMRCVARKRWSCYLSWT